MVDIANILIVDDQEANRFLLQQLIESLGYKAEMAESGIEALMAIENHEPDLVLLDLMMPQMPGDVVLQKMKEDEVFRHIPVIVISAIDDRDRIVECIENGAVDYLIKPFNAVLLRARIRVCLENKRNHDKEKQYLQEIQDANAQINCQNNALRESNQKLEREIEKRKGLESDSQTVQKMALRNAHASGMAEIANAVLHNIGNTLNSVNTSCYRIQQNMRHSHLNRMHKANQLLRKSGLLQAKAQTDQALFDYYVFLEAGLKREKAELNEEVENLIKKVKIIMTFINRQRKLTEGAVFKENINVNRVINEVLRMQHATLRADRIKTLLHLPEIPIITAQKAKLSFILLTLLIRSRKSMESRKLKGHVLSLETGTSNGELFIKISDTGKGLRKDQIMDIFTANYLSETGEGGFDLHNTAIAVGEIGGKIHAESEGLNMGTTITITFPLDEE